MGPPFEATMCSQWMGSILRTLCFTERLSFVRCRTIHRLDYYAPICIFYAEGHTT